MESSERSIAVRDPSVPTGMAVYEPRNFDDALKIAKIFVASGLTKFKSPEAAVYAMAVGADLGIPATTALRAIDIVEGKPFIAADLMVGLVRRNPECERFELVEHDDEHAVYEVKRKGGALQRFSFSIADAQRARLGGSEGPGRPFKPESNWFKYPGAMCMHRAAGIGCRAEFSGALFGLTNLYVTEEREDVEAGRAPAPVQPLPGARTPKQDGDNDKVRDAEFTEVESDETRIVRQLGEATTAAAVQAVAQEAIKLWPKERPTAVRDAHKAAKARISAPAPSKDAPPRERQAGEEG